MVRVEGGAEKRLLDPLMWCCFVAARGSGAGRDGSVDAFVVGDEVAVETNVVIVGADGRPCTRAGLPERRGEEGLLGVLSLSGGGEDGRQGRPMPSI